MKNQRIYSKDNIRRLVLFFAFALLCTVLGNFSLVLFVAYMGGVFLGEREKEAKNNWSTSIFQDECQELYEFIRQYERIKLTIEEVFQTETKIKRNCQLALRGSIEKQKPKYLSAEIQAFLAQHTKQLKKKIHQIIKYPISEKDLKRNKKRNKSVQIWETFSVLDDLYEDKESAIKIFASLKSLYQDAISQLVNYYQTIQISEKSSRKWESWVQDLYLVLIQHKNGVKTLQYLHKIEELIPQKNESEQNQKKNQKISARSSIQSFQLKNKSQQEKDSETIKPSFNKEKFMKNLDFLLMKGFYERQAQIQEEHHIQQGNENESKENQ